MFTTAFHDLVKPQWLATLAELKTSGGLAVSELSRRLDSSYMTVKQHCEDLTRLGYLQRSRVPRTEIGRPEIFYRLSEKAEEMFPTVPVDFTIRLLDDIGQLFGSSAPERLLYQYFQNEENTWRNRLSKTPGLLQKARILAKIREKEGLFIRCLYDAGTGLITLREFHNPLRVLFDRYPRAVTMEQRAIESALGAKAVRQSSPTASGVSGHVDFLFYPDQDTVNSPEPIESDPPRGGLNP